MLDFTLKFKPTIRTLVTLFRCLATFEDGQRVMPVWIMVRLELRQNLASVSAVVALLLGYSFSQQRRVNTLKMMANFALW